MRSIPPRITRSSRTRASRPTCPSSGTGSPTAKRGSSEFFLEPAAALPERRFLIGGNGWETRPMPPNVRAFRPRLHARAQCVQLHAARGAERRPRQHGRHRILAGDARVRGGRRGGLPDHRRVGRNRAVPEARRGSARRPRRQGRRRACALAHAGACADDRRGGASARAERAHLRAPRRRGRRAAQARNGEPAEEVAA